MSVVGSMSGGLRRMAEAYYLFSRKVAELVCLIGPLAVPGARE